MSGADSLYIVLLWLALIYGAWFFGQGQAVRLRLASSARPNSRAPYHGALCAAAVAGITLAAMIPLAWFGLPPILWLFVLLGLAVLTAGWVGRWAGPDVRARHLSERLARSGMLGVASVSVLVTLGIVLTLVVEAALFFGDVSLFDFLLGRQWAPQTALRETQAAQTGLFGAVPVFAGTFLIALIAVGIAGPIGLMIAVYLSEYATSRSRAILKPALEVLAGIPPIVYGFFALIAVGPVIRDISAWLGLAVPVQSALAAGIVMALMILPLVSSLSDDALSAVPQSLRDSSTALGATPSETVRGVVVPRALPGIAGALLLSISRAIGETMIVVMVAGRGAPLTVNPLESVTTVTVQIVALLTGDLVFDSTKTRAAFALGLTLFALTLIFNVIALLISRRVRARLS
jgi:phosphate transport system permease protein